MAPRKSVSSDGPRGPRASHAPSKIATSSKVTLESLPVSNLPETITPEYAPRKRPRIELTEDDRDRLIQEVVGFQPRRLGKDMTDHARELIYPTVLLISAWFRQNVSRDRDDWEELEKEMEAALYPLETLLESHVDKAMDKLTAWLLRNPFDISVDYDLVVPWHAGLDFDRGEHVTGMAKGQESLSENLETLRTNVEQSRYLSSHLEKAEEILDRRLAIARQRKAEVGFVKEILTTAGLSPLDEKTDKVIKSMNALHSAISPMEIEQAVDAPAMRATDGTKAWELGRKAYLNWAVKRTLSSNPDGTSTSVVSGETVKSVSEKDALDEIESEMRKAGGGKSVEKLNRAM